jgi:hypothetical protein
VISLCNRPFSSFLEALYPSRQKYDEASNTTSQASFFRRHETQNTAFSALRTEHGDAIDSSSQQKIHRATAHWAAQFNKRQLLFWKERR